MPHVNIKYFDRPISEEKRAELSAAVTQAVISALDVTENVVSIALEPVAPEEWTERVHAPEIEGRKELLVKEPNY